MTTIDLTKKRDSSTRTTFDETYMLSAFAIASRSADPSTQVGACYVSEDNKLLSVGCNQVPNNWDEDEYPWLDKNTYIIHAEMSALGNYQGSVKDFKNGTLYVTLFPCLNCAKLIANLGVKRVVYKDARTEFDEYKQVCNLFDNCNIEYVKFESLSKIETLEYDMKQDEKNTIKIRKRSLTNI